MPLTKNIDEPLYTAMHPRGAFREQTSISQTEILTELPLGISQPTNNCNYARLIGVRQTRVSWTRAHAAS